jgi:hypothetical protein
MLRKNRRDDKPLPRVILVIAIDSETLTKLRRAAAPRLDREDRIAMAERISALTTAYRRGKRKARQSGNRGPRRAQSSGVTGYA